MKKHTNSPTLTRRRFLGAAAAAAGMAIAPRFVFGAPAIIQNLGKPNSLIKGVQIGMITYSFRSMDTDAESILKYCRETGINAIELMGDTAEAFAGMPPNPYPWRPGMGRPRNPEEMTPEQRKEMEERRAGMAAYAKEVAAWRANASMDKFQQLRKMYKQAGVSIYAWKPNALGPNNTDAEVEYALRGAKALGASHVTVELPGNPDQTKRLGALAAKHKVKIAYHGHLQQTPTCWDEALAQSAYNAMNCDIGHYVAAGYDPIPLLKAKHDKIASMHVKDRQSKENGQGNLVWGQGDTPIVKVLQLMRDQKYKFPATIELEYDIPEGSDAVKEVAKCLEYCRKALEA